MLQMDKALLYLRCFIPPRSLDQLDLRPVPVCVRRAASGCVGGRIRQNERAAHRRCLAPPFLQPPPTPDDKQRARGTGSHTSVITVGQEGMENTKEMKNEVENEDKERSRQAPQAGREPGFWLII